MKTTEVTKCRSCGGEMDNIIDLGEMYPSGFYRHKHNLSKAPVVLSRCRTCSLVQLRYQIELDMYSQYWYRSGLNRSMRSDLHEIISYIDVRFGLFEGQRFLDIGCNDGTMLSFLPEFIYKAGIDPSKNVGPEAEQYCDRFINSNFSSHYFSSEKFHYITSIAMFYDIDNPHSFVDEVASILAPRGVWVIQMTDLHAMLSVNAFDNICSEHIIYWSIQPLKSLLEQHGLEIIDISYNKVNGGSIRLAVSHVGQRIVSKTVHLHSYNERVSTEDIALFLHNVELSKAETLAFVLNNEVYGYGASTKGNTLLQYFGLTRDNIVAIAEINPDKFGLKTVGSNIEIISEDRMFKNGARNIMVLPWHFKDDILPRYPNWNGSWYFPLPSPMYSQVSS